MHVLALRSRRGLCRVTAFSNGFEFEAWSEDWCNRCVKDGMGAGDEGQFCSLLTEVMASNEVPEQWSAGSDDLRDRYHCSEFEAP